MARAALHGFLLALGLILPLGVQNAFLLTQGTLHRRWRGALPAVITAGLCDTLLVGAAVSGLSLVVLAIPWFHQALGWVGVLFLAWIGWATWRTRPDPAGFRGERWPVRRQVLFALSVSLLNPHAILDTVAVVGTSSLQYAGTFRLAYTVAVITVSWLWFFGLATLGHFAGAVARGEGVRLWLNRASAVVMWTVAGQLLFALITRR